MKVEAIMFANQAAVQWPLLAIEGGGWEHVQAVFFPATISGYVAGILNLDKDQHESRPLVQLEVFDDAGQVEGSRASIIANGTRPNTVQGVPNREPFAISFMIAANGPTVVKARLWAGDAELALITFAVVGGAPDAPPDDL